MGSCWFCFVVSHASPVCLSYDGNSAGHKTECVAPPLSLYLMYLRPTIWGDKRCNSLFPLQHAFGKREDDDSSVLCVEEGKEEIKRQHQP